MLVTLVSIKSHIFNIFKFYLFVTVNVRCGDGKLTRPDIISKNDKI